MDFRKLSTLGNSINFYDSNKKYSYHNFINQYQLSSDKSPIQFITNSREPMNDIRQNGQILLNRLLRCLEFFSNFIQKIRFHTLDIVVAIIVPLVNFISHLQKKYFFLKFFLNFNKKKFIDISSGLRKKFQNVKINLGIEKKNFSIWKIIFFLKFSNIFFSKNISAFY